MRYGYARVSTEEQRTDAQLDALNRAGCDQIFQEKKSGGNMKRPQLIEMLKRLRPGDTVVVLKMDRIARSLRDLLEIQEQIQDAGAEFQSITEAIDTTTPVGRFIFQVIGSFAELERAIIRERTRAGLAAAMARGAKPGRVSPLRGLEQVLKEKRENGETLSNLARMHGVDISSIKRAIKRAEA